jgi:putative ABC transport system ATP-binding protein
MILTSPCLIHINKLCKSYWEGDNQRIIFENFNLKIQHGEFVALLGASGSGKSTLLNLISGIDLPDAGQVWIADHSITALSEAERTRLRRRHLGFVFQFFNLIPTLTVEENLFLPLELNGLNAREHRRHALNLLERVGLGNRRQSFPERLSGGEQQRLAIVRALVHQPLLLLADEPTGNLDADTGAQVLEMLLALQRQAGTTVLMVTHNREIASRGDRILQLQAGRIRAITP